MLNLSPTRITTLILSVLLPIVTWAQPFSKESTDQKLSSLSDEEQIRFIHDNHYNIYSEDFHNAQDLMQRAIHLSVKHGWKDREAYSHLYLGVVLFLKGEYKQALPSFIHSSNLFDSLHNIEGLAAVNNEMAVFFSKQKQMDAAYKHADLALTYSLEIKDSVRMGTALHHKAVFLEREGKLAEANTLYQQVYAIRAAQKDSVGLGYILQDIALVEMQKGNYAKAIAFIDQSTAIRANLGDRQGLAVSYVNAGETYFAAKDYPAAIRSFEKCLKLAREVGYTDLEKYTYDQLSAAFTKLNRYKEAYEFQGRARAMQDSLFNIERTKVIADLQTKYETEKKEQEIVLQRVTLEEQEAELERNFVVIVSLIIIVVLITMIAILIRTRLQRKQELLKQEHEISLRDAFLQASIQSQEFERKRVAQDLHDGMGQLISSLRLSVSHISQEQNTEGRLAIVSRAETILHDMHREIRSIAFNLMPQTLIQAGLVAALQEMSRRIEESGKLTVTVQSFDVSTRLPEIMEISLYRMLQEWTNNIIKYAQATRIDIQLVGYADEITVIVEDNGKGFDTAVLENSEGHGWRNIQSRASLIKTRIEIDSRPDMKGTTFILHVPHRTNIDAPVSVAINTQ